jgi:hypothetical protein
VHSQSFKRRGDYASESVPSTRDLAITVLCRTRSAPSDDLASANGLLFDFADHPRGANIARSGDSGLQTLGDALENNTARPGYRRIHGCSPPALDPCTARTRDTDFARIGHIDDEITTNIAH